MTDATGAVAGPFLPVGLRPRPLEVGCGLTLGMDLAAPRLDLRGHGSPRVAIEDAVQRGLARPPCLVSFSGGRDSSVVLATAAAVARQHGLPLPVPATFRFAAVPSSEESDWQERVVRHLGLPDWERVPMAAELDAVGPVARSALDRHGLLWPFNAHFHLPLLQRAAGGSLLTGIGGDELFGRQLWTSARRLLGGPHRVRLRSVAVALGPLPLRRWSLSRHNRLQFPWLRAETQAEVDRQLIDWRARTPIRWPAALGWYWRSRYRSVLDASMAALAAGANAQIVHPFLDASVVGAVARHFGAQGPADRSAAMRVLFADVLPDAVLTRASKAHFNEAFISDHSRSFVETWTGTGVDESVVDLDRLAAEWRSEQPDPRSLLLMQAAWLAAKEARRPAPAR